MWCRSTTSPCFNNEIEMRRISDRTMGFIVCYELHGFDFEKKLTRNEFLLLARQLDQILPFLVDVSGFLSSNAKLKLFRNEIRDISTTAAIMLLCDIEIQTMASVLANTL